MRMPAWSAAVAVAVVSLLAAGCGLSTNESPETLSRDNLPEDLGGAPETTIPTDTVETEPAEMWFVREDESGNVALRSITARVQAELSPAVVLERLIGFSADELSTEGLRTALPAETAVLDHRLDGDGVLTVDLAASFYEGPADGEGRLAFGQVVLTAAQLPQVQSVAFTLDGEPMPATDGTGAQQEGPMEPGDYASLLDRGNRGEGGVLGTRGALPGIANLDR